MWKETETGKVRFWRLWPVSEVNSKPGNPFETKGSLAADRGALSVRIGRLAEGVIPGTNGLCTHETHYSI